MSNEIIVISKSELLTLFEYTIKTILEKTELMLNSKTNNFIPNKELNDNDLLTQKEVCKMLSISEQTLIRHKHNGLISDVKIGRKSYFKKSDILNMVGV